uniref:ANK_REP_REGION domain-containing protein n=1 Tax=Mesocestoides corti TaxID=53468 RepID=A0A5K3FYJ1_MESCO
MNKSSSTECSSSFAANRKLSLPAQLDTSISFPTLQMTFFQVDTPSSAPPNFPSSEVVDEESEKVEKPTSPRQRRFHGWRRLRLPPKILISTSTATTTSRKQSRCLGVGVAPQLVQSLTSLHSGLPPPPPSPPLPHPPASTPLDLFQCLRTSKSSEVLSKRSASSDPEIAQDLPSLIKSNLCTYFLSACRAGRLQEVQQALDAGVAPTTVDPVSGKSGLHQAAKFGRLNVVQYLIESAPRELLDLQDFEKKQTALHKAAACHRRRVCESLIRAGASAVCQDVNGDTPRILALRASDKKLAHTLQIEELMQMIKRSNEEFQPSAKVTPSTPPLPHTP